MSGKKRVRGRDLAKEALWRARVALQQDSELSVRAFCQKEGFGEAAFHWWCRELLLRDREVGVERDTSSLRCGRAQSSSGSAFVERSCLETVESALPVSTPVEVVLRGGRILRVGDGFSPETVSRLVAVLESEAC